MIKHNPKAYAQSSDLPAIPVTVDTRSIRGCKNDDIYEHRDPDPHDPCDFSRFRNAKRIQGSKSDDRYRAVIATPTPAIPLTIDAFSKSERFTPNCFLIEHIFVDGGSNPRPRKGQHFATGKFFLIRKFF